MLLPTLLSSGYKYLTRGMVSVCLARDAKEVRWGVVWNQLVYR